MACPECQYYLASMRPPPESGGYVQDVNAIIQTCLCFNEAAARKRRIRRFWRSSRIFSRPCCFNEAAARKRRIPHFDDSCATWSTVASMRPPPESGGYLWSITTWPRSNPCFNEAAARKRRIQLFFYHCLAYCSSFNEAAARKRRIPCQTEDGRQYISMLQ